MNIKEAVEYDKGRLTGAAVKRIAVASMIIDHVGGHILRNWFIYSKYNVFTEPGISAGSVFYALIQVCDALGSIAFPLFCFLIAEGFVHTGSRKKYALRMLVFALISEIPFNLVQRMHLTYPGLQNVMFTLAVSILTLCVAARVDEKWKGSRMVLPIRIAVVLLGMGAAFLMRGEYVFLGVLAVALFYYLREYKYLRLLAFVPLVISSIWSLLAVPAVLLYNGTRGRQNKYFFYIFYPAHFLLIYVIMAYGLHLTPADVSGLPMTEYAETTEQETAAHDFSAQAQSYMEYFGAHLQKRSGIFSQHDAAQDFIIKELRNAGYTEDQISLDPIQGRYGKNIVLKVEGDDPTKTIIVGAHYDGDGVGDNASGTSLLLANACGLAGTKLPVTTYFVFFDEEESGLNGSEAFAETLTAEERDSVVYMINMDAIAFGDYCNIYGGYQDPQTKQITQTAGYDYACKLAEQLGFTVYGTEELSGYFEEHGEGPALDPTGFFTNPWTLEHPAPETTVDDELHAYSPTTIPASDHVAFQDRGIPYIYFEATNWYVKTDYEDMAYIGYTDVGDTSVGDGGVIMNTQYDTLEVLNEYYPGRSLEHFRLYSPLLSELLLKPMRQ